MKITALKYQRNGISGEPFYHCAYTDTHGSFIATFTTDSQDCKVKTTTCRAVNIDDLQSAWRGDHIGGELQSELSRLMVAKGIDNIYDISKTI